MHTLVTILAARGNDESKSAFRKRVGDEFVERYADGSVFDSVFDYAVTDAAGRWSDEYPDNVEFNMADIMIVLGEMKERQTARKTALVERIDKCLGTTDLREALSCDADDTNPIGWYFLNELSDRQLGFYTTACPEFIYLDDDCSNVTDDIMQDVEEHPGKYGILFADCHF